MNIGILATVGMYRTIGALYSDFLKPTVEQSEKAIAVDIVGAFALATIAINSFQSCLKKMKEDQ